MRLKRLASTSLLGTATDQMAGSGFLLGKIRLGKTLSVTQVRPKRPVSI